MPATQVPSTLPEDEENPLITSLAKIAGKSPLSKAAETSTGVIGYDPEQAFRPTGDTISIAASPGTGASTAETWSHDIALENLKREQLQFEYQQQQNALANTLKQQEAERAAQQQAFSQGLSSAEAARAAALAPLQIAQAQQSLAVGKQDAAIKAMQAKTAEQDAWIKSGGMTLDQMKQAQRDQAAYSQFLGGSPITQDTHRQFVAYYNSPQYQRDTTPTLQFNPTTQQWFEGLPTPSKYYQPASSAAERGAYMQKYLGLPNY